MRTSGVVVRDPFSVIATTGTVFFLFSHTSARAASVSLSSFSNFLALRSSNCRSCEQFFGYLCSLLSPRSCERSRSFRSSSRGCGICCALTVISIILPYSRSNTLPPTSYHCSFFRLASLARIFSFIFGTAVYSLRSAGWSET